MLIRLPFTVVLIALLCAGCVSKQNVAMVAPGNWQSVASNTWQDAEGKWRKVENNTLLASVDGKKWQPVFATTFIGSDGQYYAIDAEEHVSVSTDGKQWTPSPYSIFIGKDGIQYALIGGELKQKQ